MKITNEITKSKESLRDSIDFAVDCLVGVKQDLLNDLNHLILIVDDERRLTDEGSQEQNNLIEWEEDIVPRYSRIKKEFDNLIEELMLLKRDV